MKPTQSKWNPDEWLGRCAWCRRRINPGREVIGIEAKLRPEAGTLLPPGTIQPLPLAGANRTVPMIITALDSPARRKGADAMFQVCSDDCGRLLQAALAQELGLPTAADSSSSPTSTGIPLVTQEAAVEVWNNLCNLDQAEGKALIKQFMEEQPALGLYLSAKSEALTDHRDSPILELALCAWQCLSEAAGRPLPMATPDQIDAAEAANIAALESLEEASEMHYETFVRQILGRYSQGELLAFSLEVLMGDDAETPELAPESLGMELLWLKTMIDCLDPKT